MEINSSYTVNFYKFNQAIDSLVRILRGYHTERDKVSDDGREALEAGVVQAFEYTYELACVYIERWMKLHHQSESAGAKTRRELFRLAAKLKIITSDEKWQSYHNCRNLTVHTYDDLVEMQVIELVPDFINDVKYLSKEMEEHNDYL